MKFLNKLEDSINKCIYKVFDLTKTKLPASFYERLDKLKKLPFVILKKTKSKMRILGLKSIGYPLHYLEIAKQKSQTISSFIKEKKYKDFDQKKVIGPLKDFFKSPFQLLGMTLGLVVFIGCTTFIYQNVAKIMMGTQSLRAPASAEEEIKYIEFEKLAYQTIKNEDVFFDIQLIVDTDEQILELEKFRDEIQSNLLTLDFKIQQLPLPQGKDKFMEQMILEAVGGKIIKAVKIHQILPKRPEYFQQKERQLSVTNINLQLFTEDTKRNRQVYINFTILSSNRHIINFLKQRDAELRDYLNLNVEPIIPQLPLDEEGRQIIKDKVRFELQNLLEKHKVEGEIIEIYLDYVMVT